VPQLIAREHLEILPDRGQGHFKCIGPCSLCRSWLRHRDAVEGPTSERREALCVEGARPRSRCRMSEWAVEMEQRTRVEGGRNRGGRSRGVVREHGLWPGPWSSVGEGATPPELLSRNPASAALRCPRRGQRTGTRLVPLHRRAPPRRISRVAYLIVVGGEPRSAANSFSPPPHQRSAFPARAQCAVSEFATWSQRCTPGAAVCSFPASVPAPDWTLHHKSLGTFQSASRFAVRCRASDGGRHAATGTVS
jgi:hypothetical protein